MKKTFLLNSSIVNKSVDDDGKLTIKGYASTSDVDRVGDVITPTAWSKGGLDNFKKNPIILFNHDYNHPIGKAVEIENDEKGLLITAEIFKGVAQASLIEEGILTTFSVGFLIKDAEYDRDEDQFTITDAELLETSVVSVPCNQDAVFSLAKSFDSNEKYKEFLKKELDIDDKEEKLEGEEEVKTSETPKSKTGEEDEITGGINEMNEEQIKAMVEEAAQKMLKERAEKDAAEAKAKSEREELETNVAAKAAEVATASVTKSVEEKMAEMLENSLKIGEGENSKTFAEVIGEIQTNLSENAEGMSKFLKERKEGLFEDRGSKANLKDFNDEMENAFLLARITDKGYETDYAKNLIEKVNTHSTVTVSSDAFETTVSNNIERDIENELILAPLFRTINMNSARMTMPIMPDAGYAEITANKAASGTAPNGNMDIRGAAYGAPYEGITLSEIDLTTVKMISKAYLGNETEEDAIIPILPLIREALIRSHARGVENMILAGNDADGVYTSGAVDGLLALARTNGRMVTTAASDTALTAASLFGLRKVMGKYGLRPTDIAYIVSQQAYYELIEDAEFQDADLVGNNKATKLTGEIGSVYGSPVMMSDEFAAPGLGTFHALAVNRRNFVVPRLRGLTMESEYSVEDQHRVMVTSQRLGFNEIIPNAPSVVGLRYATA